MRAQELKLGRSLIARLDHGIDIISQITGLARNEKIEFGIFNAIGALIQVELTFYDQVSHKYQKILIEEPVELVSCSGNISIRDDQLFVHAHAAVADSEGHVLGGHLICGKVFAAEISLQELSGEPVIKKYDSITGLYLWDDK